MKILHVIPYMHPTGGGPPVVVDRVSHQHNQLGITADILTTNLYADESSDKDWTQYWNSADRMEVCPVTRQTPYANSPQLIASLQARVPDYDIVNVHTLWSSCTPAVRKVCRAHGKPYVVMPHGMLDPNSLRRKRLKKQIYGALIEFPVLRSAAGFFFTHEEEERLARQSVSGLPPAWIVPMGADHPPDERDILREEFYQKQPDLRDKPIVVFLSRLHEKKGLDLLIPAMAFLKKSIPDVRLLMVGGGTPEYETDLKNLIHAEAVDENVIMTGNLTGRDKWQAMAAGDVFALTSYQENFALVVVDAMTLGLPAVISHRVNIWSNVVDAEAGLECQLDPLHIAQQLQAVLSSPEDARKMGENGKALVEREFTWPKFAERTLVAYEEIVRGNRNV